MNRRDFLKSLLALGAGLTLPALGNTHVEPILIESLSGNEVDAIWEQGVDLFEVSDWRTISFADFAEPQTRADAYGIYGNLDADALINLADRLPLGWRLQGVYENFRDSLAWELDGVQPEMARQALQARLQSLLIEDDPDYGWINWLKVEPDVALPLLQAEAVMFLDEPPDWGNEFECLPHSANAQGAAYQFLLTEDPEVLEALGIVIVEGDHPGSSYFAAELHIPLDEANAAARAADLPFRFKAA